MLPSGLVVHFGSQATAKAVLRISESRAETDAMERTMLGLLQDAPLTEEQYIYPLVI